MSGKDETGGGEEREKERERGKGTIAELRES